MALITTLIPAYSTRYLGQALRSLNAQTWRDFKVIVSDDSPDQSVTRALSDGDLRCLAHSLQIEILRGPGHSRLNHQSLLSTWNETSELVHFLHDDDVILPDFYRWHAQIHQANDLHLTISPRQILSPTSEWPIRLSLPPVIEDHSQHIIGLEGGELIRSILVSNRNWVGELTNMVMSRRGARCFPLAPMAGRMNYFGLMDLGLVFECARSGKIAFIRDHLSYWRHHDGQSTYQTRSHGWRMARLCWVYYTFKAWHDGHLNGNDLGTALNAAAHVCDTDIPHDSTWQKMRAAIEHGADDGALAVLASIESIWLEFLAEHHATRSMNSSVDRAPETDARLSPLTPA